ncbi:MAG: radical SAM protein [Oscillospiraceae bacterium]|nr:radical SAM protein [Oscillospiraceae bacterium]
MFYKLKSNFALRGWEKLPYALRDINGGGVGFISEQEFHALSLCDGRLSADSPMLLPVHKEIIQKAVERGVVEETERPAALAPHQKYRLHPTRYMHTAHWSVTGRCNYKCRHCYMSAPGAKYGELSHERCMSIIDELHGCGIAEVTLTGGEALVRKDFWELVDRLLAYGIRISTIYSNGRLVNNGTLDALERRRIYPEFNLSFDGIGWHDWLRGVEGAEKEAVAAFKLCRERGFPTGAEMCLHKRNRHTLRDSVNFMASLGVSHVKTNPVSASGDWLDNAGGDSLTLEELYEVYLDYIPRFFEDGAPMGLQLGGFFMASKGEDKYWLPSVKAGGSEDAGRQTVCAHARNVMYISAEGRVLPCMSLSGLEIQKDFPLIPEIGLTVCLTDSAYLSLITTTVDKYIEQNTECAACEWKYHCCAGCRASAVDRGGHLMGPDRAVCLLFKGGYIPRVLEAAKGYTCLNYGKKAQSEKTPKL